MKKIIYFFSSLILLTIMSCGAYSFTGGSTGDAKTIQIDYFPNNAPLIEPSLSQDFTLALQDLFIRQTNLNLVKSGGDLHLEGEITQYRIAPMSATSQQTAAQNRVTIAVKVTFTNKLKEDDNFEKTFSFYHDYGADQQLTGNVLEAAKQDIFEHITQDIFNESVAKW